MIVQWSKQAVSYLGAGLSLLFGWERDANEETEPPVIVATHIARATTSDAAVTLAATSDGAVTVAGTTDAIP